MYDIIMPVGSYEPLLLIAIKSAINQTLPYENFIFVLDTSSEKEYLICKEIISKVERNIILRTPRVGQGKARQAGIEKSKNKFIAFLDFDDIWHPSKMEMQINKLEKNNASFSFTSYRNINTLDNSLLSNVLIKKNLSLIDLFISNPIAVSSVVCSRNIFDGDFQFSQIRNRSDYATWLRIYRDRKPKTIFLSDYLVLISKRPGSLSSKYWVSSLGLKTIIKVYKDFGFNNINSILIGIIFSFFQFFVKANRKYNFLNSKKSKNVNDFQYESFLK